MKRILLLSDTHGYWDERYARYASEADDLWHAGDIGSTELYERFQALGLPVRAVCGNCDGGVLRRLLPETLRLRCEQVDVLMRHIGGYPGHYERSVAEQIARRPPQLFISGHSHILRIERDPHSGLLHINPGAAGLQGWQRVRTMVRFSIDGERIADVEVIHLS